MKSKHTIWIHIFFVIFTLPFLIPLLLVISASFTSESEILNEGYKLIPSTIDFTAYQYVFSNPTQLVNSYIVTALESFMGTFLAVASMALCGYALSRPNYGLRKFTTYYILVPMLFNGGLVPSYIINTTYLHLGDTFWIYVLPGLVNTMQVIIFRTFFQGLPGSLVESAKIDGAGELRVFAQIILPLSKPVLATIGLLQLLDRWNNWNTSLIYIRNENLYTLQYLLQRILNEAEFLANMAQNAPAGVLESAMKDIPTEGMRFAMCVIATGPMLVVFPFFQKYFTKGLTVGAVKG